MNYKKEIDVSELYHIYYLIDEILDNEDNEDFDENSIYNNLILAKNILRDAFLTD